MVLLEDGGGIIDQRTQFVRFPDGQVSISVISEMKEKGAEVLILGCTELPMTFDIIGQKILPAVDPTEVLARAAVRFAGAPVKNTDR